MNHLSDEDIQKYLDNDPELNKAEVDNHLKICDRCRQDYMIYKQLYSELTDETGFMLSANFSESVVSRIKKNKEKSYNFFEGLLLAVAGLFSVGLIFYFTNLGAVFLDIFAKSTVQLKPFFEGTGNILGGNLTIILFAIIVLILFGFADRLFLSIKHR